MWWTVAKEAVSALEIAELGRQQPAIAVNIITMSAQTRQVLVDHHQSLQSPDSQAAARSADRIRNGFPPGGLGGPPSSSRRASKISSIDTGAFSPAGERKEGEAIAEASDAHEARMARFSAMLSRGSRTRSRGCSNTVPG